MKKLFHLKKKKEKEKENVFNVRIWISRWSIDQREHQHATPTLKILPFEVLYPRAWILMMFYWKDHLRT
jgi:hypothetical protein